MIAERGVKHDMIRIENLSKTFSAKEGNVDAVKNVSLTIEDGDVYGVIGYSGAGKSTLVRCLNLLETPDNGSLEINDSGKITFRNGIVYEGDGQKRMKEKQINEMRRSIGMIFQHFNLLDRSTVFENIAYPLKYSGMSREDIRKRVFELLELVDLRDKTDSYPSQLSGGQKQRVAIARALANHPRVLLSDEATSALDPEATESILALLRDLNEKLGLTIVLITHEMSVIKAVCQHVAVMENGEVVEKGDVYDVFSHPRQAISRRFVASASALSRVDKMLEQDSPLVRVKEGEMLLRLHFSRDTVGDAVISTISREYRLKVSIVLASVEVLQGDPLGGMIVVVSGERADQDAAMEYLKKNGVEVEVLRNGTHA